MHIKCELRFHGISIYALGLAAAARARAARTSRRRTTLHGRRSRAGPIAVRGAFARSPTLSGVDRTPLSRGRPSDADQWPSRVCVHPMRSLQSRVSLPWLYSSDMSSMQSASGVACQRIGSKGLPQNTSSASRTRAHMLAIISWITLLLLCCRGPSMSSAQFACLTLPKGAGVPTFCNRRPRPWPARGVPSTAAALR